MSLVVPLADLHCGARSGLTPPDWQWPITGKRGRWGKVQRATWSEYQHIQERVLKKYGRPDVVVLMGDLIDGPSSRTRGATLITADVIEQADMAVEALLGWHAKRYLGVYGTGYHVGNDADWEEVVATGLEKRCSVSVNMKSQQFFRLDGWLFRCKHHVGDSSTPYGWATPLAREQVGNLLWWAEGGNGVPRADIFLHAHVHAYRRVGGVVGGKAWHSVSLPALQAAVPDLGATRYARRLGLRVVHWGVVPILLDSQHVFFDVKNVSVVKPARVEVVELGDSNTGR